MQADTHSQSQSHDRVDVAVIVLMVFALFLVMRLHLLAALFAGLLVYELVHIVAPRLPFLRGEPNRAKLVVVALIATSVVLLVGAVIVGAVLFFRSESGSLSALLQRMAETIDGSRATLPEWARDWLPVADAETLREWLVEWLRAHSKEISMIGGEAGHALAHALIGLVIGAIVSLREAGVNVVHGPLAACAIRSVARLGDGFRRIVFAQVRISALNAVLTGLYLVVLLPLFGVHLPLAKTMILLTFVVGLVPVLGNLISNTVIVVISLGHSLQMAAASLVFLVVIHKLEYFVNARIVGSQIRASPWELLTAMLVMEASFGVPGVVAAPVFYAYAKAELEARKLI